MENIGFQSDALKIQREEDNGNRIERDKELNGGTKGKVNVKEEITCVEESVVVEDNKHKGQAKQTQENQTDHGGDNIEFKYTITSQKDMEDNFHVDARHSLTLKKVSKKLSNGVCSVACLKRSVYSRLPFINIMKNYNIKKDITGDIVAGLTVGIMHIPQGIAHALLATLSPVYGLYTAFSPVIIYFFFGSSKHTSLGTSTIICLMIGSAVSKRMDSLSGYVIPTGLVPSSVWNVTENHTANLTETPASTPIATLSLSNDMFDTSPEGLDLRLQFAMSLTFMVGLFQLLMSVLRLGCITEYMSDALICGFTTGIACHVFTSQVKDILSIKITRYSGAFKLIYIYRDVFNDIAGANYVTVLLSVSSMAVLYCISRFINQNQKLRRRMCMPVPTELIVVVIGIVISYVLNLEQLHNVPVIPDIPTGLPVPNTKGISQISLAILVDVIPIVIVNFYMSISAAKLSAKIHNYDVDANQELLAFGISSVMCSFVSSLAPSVALSRAVLQDKVGGKTQIAGLMSCCLLLVVLLVLGPYFKPTPKCVLASVIVVSLRPLFLQIWDLKNIYRVSKTDFIVWIVAFISTVILDVDLGLGVSIAFNILTVICRIQRPYASLLGQMPGTDLYRDISVYQEAKEIPGIKLFRCEQSLFFLNKEHFRTMLYKKTANPATLIIAKQRKERRLRKVQRNSKTDIEMELPGEFNIEDKNRNTPDVDFRTLVIDCSPWNLIDSVGVKVLTSIIIEYQACGISVMIVNCKDGVLDVFERTNFYKTLDKSNIYVSLHDAISHALSVQNLMSYEQNIYM